MYVAANGVGKRWGNMKRSGVRPLVVWLKHNEDSRAGGDHKIDTEQGLPCMSTLVEGRANIG